MRYSYVTALLAFGVELASAATFKRMETSIEKRQNPVDLSDTCASKLESIGFSSSGFGVNAQSSGTGVWIGTDGPYTNNFVNNSGDEVCLVVWGDQPAGQASFPTAVQPLITVSLAANGGSLTLSFDGQSGAFAPVYPDTVLTQFGQIQNTWGEFTYTSSGVVDISREVYTQGNNVEIIGPDCTTNMDTCVFVCNDPSVTTCGDAGSYNLANCANGSQPGATNGDNINGGCGWLGATTAQFTTNFS